MVYPQFHFRRQFVFEPVVKTWMIFTIASFEYMDQDTSPPVYRPKPTNWAEDDEE